ncbi:hypothetical protein IFM89_003607 [Coptis chinensis]|uniref:DUF2828 domain-containing protein n=1 Tax=Coptis chinensis TaxID=261450 RepID=A0A835LE62_9MAGN|nr:hypothetical protein IFM89_003607 [Coptis chinensis]
MAEKALARYTNDPNYQFLHDQISALFAELLSSDIKCLKSEKYGKVIAEKKIRTEIPGCDIYVPTLTLEGLPVKIVDPKIRESCVAGYTFVLGSLELVELLHSSVS